MHVTKQSLVALQGMKDSEVDFKFRVSPAEQRIIELRPDPPSSIILLGRSGTGKTTCAVFRMFGRWLYAKNQGEVDNMVSISEAACDESKYMGGRNLQVQTPCRPWFTACTLHDGFNRL